MKLSEAIIEFASGLESSHNAQQKDLDILVEQAKALETTTPPPDPDPPPTTGKKGLWVDGLTLRTKTGAAANWRGMEMMWGLESDQNAVKLCDNVKAFGANAISPLFQGNFSATDLRECLAAARSRGLMVGVNADHTGDELNWITRADIVAACNESDHVMLECMVELSDAAGEAHWRDSQAIPFVQKLRAAGHTAPIKVGSPDGGRSPRYALNVGKSVLAADPLKSLIFTWQAYWHSTSGGWQYATNGNGFPHDGTAGALECADALRMSGLCFIVGLDGKDNVGETPWKALSTRLHELGIGWQWWAWMVGDAYGNGVVPSTMSTTPKAPYGALVKAIMLAQSKLADLG